MLIDDGKAPQITLIARYAGTGSSASVARLLISDTRFFR